MHPIRALAGLAALAALGSDGGARSQDKGKPGPEPGRPAAKAQLPLGWDNLNLPDAQRSKVLKLTSEYREKRDKLLEEMRKRDADLVRARAAVLTEDQRQKLLDLVSGPAPKVKAGETGKAEPKPKGKEKNQ
jgi:Spy/CpxP family protein refolding chaperone